MEDPRPALEAERARNERLLLEVERSMRDVSDARQDANSDDEHDPEGSTIAFERAAVASMLRDARQELRDLDEAEGRVDAGTYGVCEKCGREIADARLDALPAARRCIECNSLRR